MEVNKEELLDEAKLYESILQNVPGDTFSLERLIEIYEQCHETEKEAFYRHRVETVKSGVVEPDSVVKKNQTRGMNKTKQLRAIIAEHHRGMVRQSDRPNISLSSKPQGSKLLQDKSWLDKRPYADLYIRLREWRLLNEETFIFLMRRLSALNLKDMPQKPYGALHLLNEAPGVDYPKILKALIMTSAMNLVDLVEFSDFNVISDLPKELLYHMEVVVFSKCNEEISIAMLNPYNNQLKQLLEDYYALPVEFYLADVNAFDTFIKGGETNGSR